MCRRGPGDEDGPDRCRDDAAHREGEVARRRARGRFRSGGIPRVESPVRSAGCAQACATESGPRRWRSESSASSRAAVITQRSLPTDQPAPSSSAATGYKRAAAARRQIASPRLGEQAPARLCLPPNRGTRPARRPRAIGRHWFSGAGAGPGRGHLLRPLRAWSGRLAEPRRLLSHIDWAADGGAIGP